MSLERNGRGWIDKSTGNLVDRKHRCLEIIFEDGRAIRVRTMADARHVATLRNVVEAETWLALASPSRRNVGRS